MQINFTREELNGLAELIVHAGEYLDEHSVNLTKAQQSARIKIMRAQAFEQYESIYTDVGVED